MLIDDLKTSRARRNFIGKYSGIDSPDRCTNSEWFENYPVQDFNYSYNSWGFRGPDYNQYLGKPVILCLGDSFTVNLGGPIEHSWPSLIQKHFGIPCINLGMDGAGNDAMQLVYNRACELFNVNLTFVVYSYLHRRLENGVFKSEPHDHLENIEYFEKHKIKDWVIYQFLPTWCYTSEEQDYLYTMVKPFIPSQIYWNKHISRSLVLENEYNNLSGSDWPTYSDFLSGQEPHSDVVSDKFKLPLHYRFHTNRDGHHMSLDSNQKLAESLIEQWKQS